MNLLDFYCQYPNEASCEEALRRFREHHGLSLVNAAVCA